MKRLAFFIALLVIWLLLTWSWSSQSEKSFLHSWQQEELLVGIVLSLGLALVLGSLYKDEPKRLFQPARWFHFLLYVPYFFYYCIKANLDVAYRVLHPDLPIRPGIVKVTTSLETDVAKTFLANSITLTPGTLTVDIRGQDLFVHWINVVGRDTEERTEIIVRRFERMLARIFE